jgi:hypothetical protein
VIARAMTWYVLLAALVTAGAAWLLWRAALHGLRRFVRNLWPH